MNESLSYLTEVKSVTTSFFSSGIFVIVLRGLSTLKDLIPDKLSFEPDINKERRPVMTMTKSKAFQGSLR